MLDCAARHELVDGKKADPKDQLHLHSWGEFT